MEVKGTYKRHNKSLCLNFEMKYTSFFYLLYLRIYNELNNYTFYLHTTLI